MNKLNRIIGIACLSLLGIAGAAFGMGYASWVYSDGGAAAKSADAAASVGSWTYISGYFYLMNADGTVDWNTQITPANYDAKPTNKKHIYYVENPSDTKICAYYPYGCTPSDGSSYVYLTGTESYGKKTSQLANPDKVQQIYLPNSYTSIGDYSFYYSTLLSEVHFYDASSEGATAMTSFSIGQYSFYGSTYLSSFAFPSVPTTIAKAAFYGCNFTTMDLSHVTTTGYGSLGGNTALTSVTFSNSLTTLGSSLFWGDSALKSLDIPSSITSISDNMCNGCAALKSVTLEGQVNLVDEAAFMDCPTLINITLPSSLSTIGSRAYSLTNVHRPLFIDFGGTRTQWNAISKGTDWDHNRTVYLRCLGESKAVTSTLSVLDYIKANPNNGTTNAGYTVDVTCADGTIHYMDSSDQYTVDMADNAKVDYRLERLSR
jgi:hypothetical protein